MIATASSSQTVEALERDRVVAVMAGDVDALDLLLHDDVVFGHTDGHADDKAAYLGKFRSGAVRYRDADHRIENVRLFGEAALVNLRLTMRVEGPAGSRKLDVAALTVWTQDEDGRWRMVAHQPTLMAP